MWKYIQVKVRLIVGYRNSIIINNSGIYHLLVDTKNEKCAPRFYNLFKLYFFIDIALKHYWAENLIKIVTQ